MEINISRYRAIIFLVLLVLILAIPITLRQLKKQQETRSRAGGGETVTLSFSPQSATKSVGESLDVAFALDGATNNVTGVDITIGFNKDILELTSFVPSSTFNSQLINGPPNNTIGTFRYAAVSTTSTPISGTITLGTLKFTAKAAGTTTVNVQNAQITAQGVTSALPVNSSTGTYTVSGTAATRPTSTPTSPPTPTPCETRGGCPTPTPFSTPTPLTPTPIPCPFRTGCPNPTPTQANPTPTLMSGDTAIGLSVELPAIGSGSARNNNPRRRTRTANVLVLNALNQVVNKNQTLGDLVFNGSIFSGSVHLGRIPSGNYTVKVRLDNTLFKLIPGIQTITEGEFIALPSAVLIPGDLDGNNRLDILDYNRMLECIQNKPTCTPALAALANLNDDETADHQDKVDEVDLNILQRGFLTREGD